MIFFDQMVNFNDIFIFHLERLYTQRNLLSGKNLLGAGFGGHRGAGIAVFGPLSTGANPGILVSAEQKPNRQKTAQKQNQNRPDKHNSFHYPDFLEDQIRNNLFLKPPRSFLFLICFSKTSLKSIL